MDIDHAHIAIKAIDFWALFTCIGLLIVRVALLPASSFGIEQVARIWRRLLGSALALLTATGLALPLLRIMEMGDGSLAEALPLLPSVFRQTHFGLVWGLHLLGLLALWIGWLVSWRSSGRSAVSFMLAIAILTAYTYSASSHAADGGDFTLAELGDWLHVLSASAWGGGILASALFISILGKQPTRHRVAIGKMMGRLSSLSAAALALVLLTGVYNAALRLNGLNDLADTSYGQALGIKLILVAAMAVIGAVNRLIFVPKIRRWAAQTDAADIRPVRQIVASLGADVFLVLLILCAAAVLIQSMPPAVTKHTPGMSHPHSAQ